MLQLIINFSLEPLNSTNTNKRSISINFCIAHMVGFSHTLSVLVKILFYTDTELILIPLKSKLVFFIF